MKAPALPAAEADPAYVSALREVMQQLQSALAASPRKPITVCIAGGTAVHLYTGARVSKDIDAKVMARFLPPDELAASYTGRDGKARLLYFDMQYNDTFGLLHARAYDDALPLTLEGIDPAIMDLRVLAPLDLAVSKLSRYETQDQQDIRELARRGLVDSLQLRQRAEEALPDYVGSLERVRLSIDLAQKLVSEAGSSSSPRS